MHDDQQNVIFVWLYLLLSEFSVWQRLGLGFVSVLYLAVPILKNECTLLEVGKETTPNSFQSSGAKFLAFVHLLNGTLTGTCYVKWTYMYMYLRKWVMILSTCNVSIGPHVHVSKKMSNDLKYM